MYALNSSSYSCCYQSIVDDLSYAYHEIHKFYFHLVLLTIDYLDDFLICVDQPNENVFMHKTIVNALDCDKLGHLNNSIYATIAEEVRLLALKNGGYNNVSSEMYTKKMYLDDEYLGYLEPSIINVSYIGQSHQH